MTISDYILQCSAGDKKRWVSFFQGFPKDAEISVISIEEKGRILSEGESAENVFVLIKGKARLNIMQRKGFHYILDKGEQTTIFGDLEVINNEKEYYATVTAQSDCQVIAFAKETYLQWINSSPDTMFRIMKGAINTILAQLFSERGNLFLDANVRMTNTLLHYYENHCSENNSKVCIRLTRQEISDTTGYSIRTVARRLEALEERGYISRENRHCYITAKQYKALQNYLKECLERT